ncbi:esterase/lipase family protein [Ohessyouella blattaphilus]|uniref:Triacylglycerol lipase n=1 Tax=Ohessyouella blattaphilus TaxID=2949333 RepID=A0ABT1EGM8_9FIRM|nr:alpha/beta fold hydrolase [Ohessyouella blattaphilus]MCP1109854.1 triacylglycerol lipase [Ohessyouella blattaphilus]MCR8563248.1 triacylglycerol lipase [Ohessyouella blattaphilus]MDL2250808.1 triacylglycerol lipase [Lachnospiraceae bacterium OttesenSCG-928-J05]
MIKKILTTVLLVMVCNFILWQNILQLKNGRFWLVLVLSLLFYLAFSVLPERFSVRDLKYMTLRMKVLYGGCELLTAFGYGFMIELVFYVILLIVGNLPWRLLLANALVFLVLFLLLEMQGIFRLLLLSKQIKVGKKLMVMFFWWIPIFNIYIIRKVTRIARIECEVESHIAQMDAARAENQVCQTKYPILMVHGVFFRDWQYFNYWGRIPKELIKNGANVYYGKQESALAVKESAKELSAQIEQILEETGAPKLNIIAHSKGGLDSRYAISMYGMHEKVASLTTINTPHYGCKWADILLGKLPLSVVKKVAKTYNKMFKKLGDAHPDFIGAVEDLTEERALVFNQEVMDMPGVLYQSVMSKMNSPKSAGFPLSLTYRIINMLQKVENDGLVPITSAKWGEYLGDVVVSGRRGISHGDMIDLFRENIAGFEVRNFYVDLIKDLKSKGY